MSTMQLDIEISKEKAPHHSGAGLSASYSFLLTAYFFLFTTHLLQPKLYNFCDKSDRELRTQGELYRTL